MGRAPHLHANHVLLGEGSVAGREEARAEKRQALKTVLALLSGDRAAMEKLTLKDIEVIAFATLSGMTVEQFQADVKQWIATAKDARWKRPLPRRNVRPNVGSAPLPARQRLQDVHCDGGWPGFVRVRPSRCTAFPPSSGRLCRRHQVRLR